LGLDTSNELELRRFQSDEPVLPDLHLEEAEFGAGSPKFRLLQVEDPCNNRTTATAASPQQPVPAVASSPLQSLVEPAVSPQETKLREMVQMVRELRRSGSAASSAASGCPVNPVPIAFEHSPPPPEHAVAVSDFTFAEIPSQSVIPTAFNQDQCLFSQSFPSFAETEPTIYQQQPHQPNHYPYEEHHLPVYPAQRSPPQSIHAVKSSQPLQTDRAIRAEVPVPTHHASQSLWTQHPPDNNNSSPALSSNTLSEGEVRSEVPDHEESSISVQSADQIDRRLLGQLVRKVRGCATGAQGSGAGGGGATVPPKPVTVAQKMNPPSTASASTGVATTSSSSKESAPSTTTAGSAVQSCQGATQTSVSKDTSSGESAQEVNPGMHTGQPHRYADLLASARTIEEESERAAQRARTVLERVTSSHQRTRSPTLTAFGASQRRQRGDSFGSSSVGSAGDPFLELAANLAVPPSEETMSLSMSSGRRPAEPTSRFHDLIFPLYEDLQVRRAGDISEWERRQSNQGSSGTSLTKSAPHHLEVPADAAIERVLNAATTVTRTRSAEKGLNAGAVLTNISQLRKSRTERALRGVWNLFPEEGGTAASGVVCELDDGDTAFVDAAESVEEQEEIAPPPVPDSSRPRLRSGDLWEQVFRDLPESLGQSGEEAMECGLSLSQTAPQPDDAEEGEVQDDSEDDDNVIMLPEPRLVTSVSSGSCHNHDLMFGIEDVRARPIPEEAELPMSLDDLDAQVQVGAELARAAVGEESVGVGAPVHGGDADNNNPSYLPQAAELYRAGQLAELPQPPSDEEGSGDEGVPIYMPQRFGAPSV